MRAMLPGGGELLFCRHHARMHAERLTAVAVEITESAPEQPR